ncbi:MAG TPA: GntR family transcriptional regulator [Aliiroseovarius sp.]|nr:GntR family transcriptional regulator [Aliiroseovarius sp.]
MDKGSVKLPEHEKAYRDLRDMILFGELKPGQAVTIQGLIGTLKVGMTPVREAIRRLTSQGALVFQGNRRVSVPEMTASQWDDIALVRLVVEPELARRSLENIGVSQVNALTQTDADLNAAIAAGDVRGYLECNTRFHMDLYALAGSDVLLSVAQSLWLRGGPSLRVVLGRYGTANLPDKHAEALEAMTVGDADALANAISGDIQQGIDQVRLSFAKA